MEAFGFGGGDGGLLPPDAAVAVAAFGTPSLASSGYDSARFWSFSPPSSRIRRWLAFSTGSRLYNTIREEKCGGFCKEAFVWERYAWRVEKRYLQRGKSAFVGYVVQIQRQ